MLLPGQLLIAICTLGGFPTFQGRRSITLSVVPKASDEGVAVEARHIEARLDKVFDSDKTEGP